MKNMHKSTKGFTLVEILLAVVIIGGLLTAISIPMYKSISQSNRIDNTYIALQSFTGVLSQFENSGVGSVFPLTNCTTAAQVAAAAAAPLDTAAPAAFSNAARFEQVIIGAGLSTADFRPKMGDQNFQPAGWVPGSQDIVWDRATRRFRYPTGVTTLAHNYSQTSRLISSLSSTLAPSAALGSNFRLPENNMGDLPANLRVVAAVIRQCNPTEAFELARKFNPNLLDATAPGSAQNRGRVVWAAPVDGRVDVYVYLSAL